MPLINSLVSWIMKKRIHQIELFIKYPHEVQEEWFKKLVNTAKDTEWGKKYDYKSIKSTEEFAQRVPISEYEQIMPYILRLRRGEQNVLWPTHIKWYAKSSGTTGSKSKFIPVSNESLEDCHFKGGKDMLSIYCNNNPDTNLFDGKGLALGGSHQISEFSNASYYGDLSAVLIQNLPFWAEFYRTPKADIALMHEWESKIQIMAEAVIKDDVTSLAGVPSWTLVLLNRIFELTGKTNLLEVWPNLEVFFHGGINFSPYEENFKKIIPSLSMRYYQTYNASEGFFGIQDLNNSDDMLLMLDYGIYYEFMPLSEYGKENPKTITLDKVELDVNYAVVITTNAGLWRYLIGDTIKFTNLNPFKIKITGRTRNFINAFGEELIIDNAESALQAACKKSNAILKEYTAAPVFFNNEQKGAHQWLIEFEKQPDNLEFFAEVLDNTLKSLNSDYEAKRYKSILLQMPIIQIVPQGTFYDWLKIKGKLGGQNKVPRLSNHRRHIDEILSIVSNPKKG